MMLSILLQAQSLSDIQNLKVDNLSDAQIEQLIKRAEANGLTTNQLVALARERGMPALEANKLGQRINDLRMSGQTNSTSGKMEGGRNLMDQETDLFDSLRKSDPYYDLTPTQKKIFGFKLFHNRQLNFSPSLNLPTPLSYIVGSGDQLLIDVYGASQQSYDLTVSPEGRIFVPNVGPVQVGGASIEAATVRIKNSLGRIYSGLNGANPNTFLQVRLGLILCLPLPLFLMPCMLREALMKMEHLEIFKYIGIRS